MVRRIGITMRIIDAVGYREPRDCLAQDWWSYMQSTFPDIRWIGLPNIGRDIRDYVREWGLDGFILSGGNDVGSAPKRDDTETALLEMAVDKKIPVFGVCRGLQMLNFFFGGSIIHDLTDACGKPEAHAGTAHMVSINDGVFRNLLSSNELMVNSFHRQGVTKDTLAPVLQPFAFSMDGLVEGLYHSEMSIVAIQWHPERKNPAQDADRKLIETWLKNSS